MSEKTYPNASATVRTNIDGIPFSTGMKTWPE